MASIKARIMARVWIREMSGVRAKAVAIIMAAQGSG